MEFRNGTKTFIKIEEKRSEKNGKKVKMLNKKCINLRDIKNKSKIKIKR